MNSKKLYSDSEKHLRTLKNMRDWREQKRDEQGIINSHIAAEIASLGQAIDLMESEIDRQKVDHKKRINGKALFFVVYLGDDNSQYTVVVSNRADAENEINCYRLGLTASELKKDASYYNEYDSVDEYIKSIGGMNFEMFIDEASDDPKSEAAEILKIVCGLE